MNDTRISNKTINKRKREPLWKRIIIASLTIITAVTFLAAGGSKLLGTEKAIYMFAEIGFGQWFRYFTGLIEIIGAILLLLSQTSFVGAFLLSLTMIGAILVHLLIIGGSPSIAMILLSATSILILLKPIK